MIFEAIEAMEHAVRALAVWLVIGAMVATIVLLTGLALGTWAVKRLRRAPRKPQEPAGDAQSPADGFRDAGEPPEASQAPSRPAAPWAQTDRKAA